MLDETFWTKVREWEYPRKISSKISSSTNTCFCKQRFFSAQPQCCLTFSRNELQMLIRCCLIDKNIIILIDFLYLLYLCSRPDLGLFMRCLCDLFFIFIFISIMISRMNTDSLVLLLIFENMPYYFCMRRWMKNVIDFPLAEVQSQGAA